MLSLALIRSILLDITEDPNTSRVVSFNGYEIIAVICPATLDGTTNNITPQIDPGNGVFYTPLTNSGGAITWWENVSASEYLQVPTLVAPLVGARIRLQFTEDEAADRTFLMVLKALTS